MPDSKGRPTLGDAWDRFWKVPHHNDDPRETLPKTGFERLINYGPDHADESDQQVGHKYVSPYPRGREYLGQNSKRERVYKQFRRGVWYVRVEYPGKEPDMDNYQHEWAADKFIDFVLSQ